MSSKAKDLIGMRFGKLVVLERAEGNYTKWLCQCDCGRMHAVAAHHLKSGATKSCGCGRRGPHRLPPDNNIQYSPTNVPYWYWFSVESRCRRMIGNQYTLILSLEQLQDMFNKQGYRCALSNREISFGKSQWTGITTASLDRIDSSKPYEEGNVQFVHKDVNISKGRLPDEKYKAVCFDVGITAAFELLASP